MATMMDERARIPTNCAVEDALRFLSLITSLLAAEGTVLEQVYGHLTRRPSIPIFIALIPLSASAIMTFAVGAPARSVKRLRGIAIDLTLAPLSPVKAGCIGVSDMFMSFTHLGVCVYLSSIIARTLSKSPLLEITRLSKSIVT